MLAEGDRGRGRHDRVHRRGEDRQLEPVGVDLPGDADLFGVARTPRGHDRDVVEGVGTAAALGPADLDLCSCAYSLGPWAGPRDLLDAVAGCRRATGRAACRPACRRPHEDGLDVVALARQGVRRAGEREPERAATAELTLASDGLTSGAAALIAIARIGSVPPWLASWSTRAAHLGLGRHLLHDRLVASGDHAPPRGGRPGDRVRHSTSLGRGDAARAGAGRRLAASAAGRRPGDARPGRAALCLWLDVAVAGERRPLARSWPAPPLPGPASRAAARLASCDGGSAWPSWRAGRPPSSGAVAAGRLDERPRGHAAYSSRLRAAATAGARSTARPARGRPARVVDGSAATCLSASDRSWTGCVSTGVAPP